MLNKGERVMVVTVTLYYYGTVVEDGEDYLVLEEPCGIFTEVDNMTLTLEGKREAHVEACPGGLRLNKHALISVMDASHIKLPEAKGETK